MYLNIRAVKPREGLVQGRIELVRGCWAVVRRLYAVVEGRWAVVRRGPSSCKARRAVVRRPFALPERLATAIPRP